MDSSQTIQPSYQSFSRLTQNDDSSSFTFIISLDHGQTNNNQVEIKTTLNKARVISKKVSTYYQADPTIQYIELNIPSNFNIKEEQASLKNKIEIIFQTIINSTNRPKTVSKEDLFLMILLMRLIGYENFDNNQNKTKLTNFINTVSEAVSLLTTEFHSDAIQFLSLHFVEFLKSDTFSKIEEGLILDIIDAYTEGNKSKQSNEFNEIFNVLKDKNEPLFLIHFLLRVEVDNLDIGMIEYIIGSIDDEIAEKETLALAGIAKKYFQIIKNSKLKFRLDYTGSLQTLVIPADGKYEIEAIAASGSGGNTYGTSYTSEGGRGAKIVANFNFKKGDVIDIVVGGTGTSKQATATDGASGGGGGGTFIFKRINSVTDERYQFTKGDIKYETLLAVAGGSGGEDSAQKNHSSVGYDGEASSFKSLTNYTEHSKDIRNPESSNNNYNVKGIEQFIQYDAKGAFYERANGFSRGGYGCGAAGDDQFTPGGGWCQGSNQYQSTSWSLDSNAVGIDGFNKGNGSVTILFKE